YGVDPLTVFPPKGADEKKFPDAIKPLLLSNSLCAFELASGKIGWRLGISWELGEKDPFAKSHFLAAPHPVNGKVYVLNETNQGELRLVLVSARRAEVEMILPLDKFQGS